MKENFTTVLAKFLLAIAIVAVVGVTSCAKDDAGGSPTITFENDDNRVDFSLSSTLDGYSFAEGSQVLVVDANANELTYILTNGVWTPASMDDYFVWGSEQS